MIYAIHFFMHYWNRPIFNSRLQTLTTVLQEFIEKKIALLQLLGGILLIGDNCFWALKLKLCSIRNQNIS